VNPSQCIIDFVRVCAYVMHVIVTTDGLASMPRDSQ